MARKGQIAVQDNIDTNEEFDEYLQQHYHQVICMEVYSAFCGNCVAMTSAVRKVKLELAGDDMVFAKAQADDIDALDRFRNKSEPVFLFITEGQATQIMFGANGVKLFDFAKREVEAHKGERDGTMIPRYRQPIIEPLEDELEKIEIETALAEERHEKETLDKQSIQEARKKRVNDRLSSNSEVRHMNFIMFWPQRHQAHYDLYERWDRHNVQVAAKETIQLTEEKAHEVLYMSDVELNEACLYALLDGPILAVLLKMYETDTRDFVKLMRFALYEEIPPLKDDTPEEKQPPQIAAFRHYATISKSKPVIRRERYEAKMQRKREEAEERERLIAEQERLAREAEEERQRVEKQKEDEERIARLQGGAAVEAPPAEEAMDAEGEGAAEGEQVEEAEGGEAVEGEAVEGEEDEAPAELEEAVPEEAAEEQEAEFSSQISVDGEDYIPPGGLFVPGLYAPPNDLAKANALSIFFPKLIAQVAQIESEFLPPHVLLTFPIEKRKEVMEAAAQFAGEIIQTGVFAGEIPYSAQHVAYTAKHYDRLGFRIPKPNERLALMVSHRRSVPTLTLATLNPTHVSVDTQAGAKECLALFPVGYGDDYYEEESVAEEEIEEVVEVEPEPEPEPEQEPPVEEEEEEEEED